MPTADVPFAYKLRGIIGNVTIVTQRRRSSGKVPPAPPEKQCNQLAAEFEELSGETSKKERVELAAILVKALGVLSPRHVATGFRPAAEKDSAGHSEP